jgi:hypothetical protein
MRLPSTHALPFVDRAAPAARPRTSAPTTVRVAPGAAGDFDPRFTPFWF